MPIINDIDDLKRVMKLMREERALSLHVDGVAINLSPVAFLPDDFGKPPKKEPRTDLKDPDNPDLIAIRERMNGADVDEDILFHSSGGAGATGNPPGWVGPR